MEPMTDQHPITVPPELVEEWYDSIHGDSTSWKQELATKAARWGADEELEACCAWLKTKEWIHPEFSDELRAARRPKPPSLAEEALLAIDTAVADDRLSPAVAHAVRRALERLYELEGQA